MSLHLMIDWLFEQVGLPVVRSHLASVPGRPVPKKYSICTNYEDNPRFLLIPVIDQMLLLFNEPICKLVFIQPSGLIHEKVGEMVCSSYRVQVVWNVILVALLKRDLLRVKNDSPKWELLRLHHRNRLEAILVQIGCKYVPKRICCNNI